MSNKRIEINPALFSLNGKNKTKKNKEKVTKPIITTIISPNVLKNKLLKRIKEHKNRETNNKNNEITDNVKPYINTSNINDQTSDNLNTDNNILKFSEEFNDSINYLQSLSKEKKINDEKNLYERQKLKRREELQRSTLKNYSSIPFVYNDLPDDLKEPLITVNTETFKTNTNDSPISLKYKVDNIVPYGVLKGGFKPTMREWNKTQKNRDLIYETNSNNSVINNKLTISNTDRENKLNALKEKIKEKQKEDFLKLQLQNNSNNSNNSLNKTSATVTSDHNGGHISNNTVQQSTPTNINVNASTDTNIKINTNTNTTLNNTVPIEPQPNIIKQIHKKTIRRKYTLGKSKIKKTVGILLKDKNTRKKVLIAQKELKEKSISDVKIYLRKHNLIKTGSNAPNDVLRKLYESAMLTGEVNNNNKDTMLHNFMKDDISNDNN
jgi:hypothetical protein